MCTYTVENDIVLNPEKSMRTYTDIYPSAMVSDQVPSMLDDTSPSPQAWVVTGNNLIGNWMPMDLGEIMQVKGVVTQGRGVSNTGAWTTMYKVSTSVDQNNWEESEDLNGNTDTNSKIINLLENVVSARYVRIYPLAISGSFIALRAGVLVVETACIGNSHHF